MKLLSSIRPSARTRRALVLAAVLLLGVIAVVQVWNGTPDPAATAADPAPGSVVGAAAPGAAEESPRPGRAQEPAGGRVDVARLFELDETGHLVIDSDTSVALEILLGDLPEPPTAQDLQRVEDLLRQGLPAGEADKAIGLLRNYRAYVNEAEQQIAPGGIPQNLAEVDRLFDRMAAVRLKHFDRRTADALFGAHEAYARYSMQTTFIEQDPDLSGPAKQERLDQLRAQLPAEVKAMITPMSAEQDELEHQIAALRRNGGTDAQIDALRQRQAGQPAP